MIAIDEVNVRVTGRTEENEIPRRLAGGGVSGGIALAEIRFGFDDAASENSARRFADEQFSKQGSRDLARIAVEEVRFQ